MEIHGFDSSKFLVGLKDHSSSCFHLHIVNIGHSTFDPYSTAATSGSQDVFFFQNDTEVISFEVITTFIPWELDVPLNIVYSFA